MTGICSMLVLGGARSGKSAYAEHCARASGLERVYVATAEAYDDEMRAKIARHRAERADHGWRTIEESLHLAEIIRREAQPERVLLVDCLTLWLSNMMLAGRPIAEAQLELIAALQEAAGPVILVSNEVGLGLVPETPLGREFRDAQGRLNQVVAASLPRVVFIAAGLPLVTKDLPPVIRNDSLAKNREAAMPTSYPASELDARHHEKMKKRKLARDKIMATKTAEKGLLIVHTGSGKGKSSAALGMVFRHIGHGMPVGVVQFTKSPEWVTGEALLLRRFPDLCTLEIMGEGFTWDTQDRARDVAAARKAWERAKELIRDDRHQMVLLDELNIVLRYDYLPIEEVVDFLAAETPPGKHVVVTGRNAKPELIEIADLVTEMTLVKHPFKDGVKAQKGIEF